MNVDSLDWGKGDGLLPAIVQDHDTRQVLMLGYVNEAALRQTLETRQVTFYSRSKQRLWTKGETSGNHLQLVSALADCDQDTVLFLVRPSGPACHRNTVACFDEPDAPGIGFLAQLWATVQDRARDRPSGSYTTKLLDAGVARMAQKVGEEAVEVAVAAVADDGQGLRQEAADLIYHLWVLLAGCQSGPEDVLRVLRERHGRSPARTA